MFKIRVFAKYRLRVEAGADTHYHVTSKKNAQSILRSGYFDENSASMGEYFTLIDDQVMEDLLKAKGVDIEELEELEDEYDEWVEHYGDGTILFTSREQMMEYGDTVLEFTPPADVTLLQDDMHGTMWYYPKTIPPKHFIMR